MQNKLIKSSKLFQSSITSNKGKKKRVYINGENILSLDNLHFTSYEKTKEKIERKLGKRPKRPEDLPVGDWTEQSLRILGERYLAKDDDLNPVETPEDMCWRVAWEIASVEAVWRASKKETIKKARDFYQLLVSCQFLPNSPTLMNAGTGNMLQYSGCFVVPVEDSLVGIFDALKYQALIHQTGGGTGFSFSRLRPNGSMVKSSKGIASGPVSFMRIFDAATNEVKQGGKRRGANMGILRVDHPDILDFIHCKKEGGITNFNISVAVTDEFMKAYELDGEYELINPKTKSVSGTLSARRVFNEIAQAAWETGDPGVIFIDRINNSISNPVPSLGPIESTNPCGEQPLYPFDSCNLGSIFLNNLTKKEGNKKVIDWEKLDVVTREATRFLDNVIEINPYTLPQIRQMTLAVRRIGLGVGGWADTLIDLGIPYDSDQAISLGEKVMKAVGDAAVSETQELAKKRGAFPLWPISIYSKEKPRRNSTVTTVAPTGTISIIAGASSGIEPLFAIAYRHIVRDKHLDRQLSFVNPKFEELAKEKGFWSEDIGKIVAESGTVRQIEDIQEDVRSIFGTAHEIDPVWHIKMQAVFQKYTENAVSKTINLNKEASIDDVKKAYLLAWEMGCKGITIFRDGCKKSQVLNLGVNKEHGVKTKLENTVGDRPFKVTGATYKLATPVGKAFVTINQDENGDPLELFINVGKAGSDVAAMAEALGRTISTSLRLQGWLAPRQRAEEIAHQLSGIGGRRSVGFGPNKILSLPDAVSIALSYHYGFKINGNLKVGTSLEEYGVSLNGTGSTVAANGIRESGKLDPAAVSVPPSGTPKPENFSASRYSAIFVEGESVKTDGIGDICPSCGASALVYEEGCSKCHACGYSEC